jgi:hypothetical protein
MKLVSACRRLHHSLASNNGLHIRTYWYRPGRIDVQALRSMNRQDALAVLAHAENRGDAGMLSESAIGNSSTEQFSIRQWFRNIGLAIAASLHLTR